MTVSLHSLQGYAASAKDLAAKRRIVQGAVTFLGVVMEFLRVSKRVLRYLRGLE